MCPFSTSTRRHSARFSLLSLALLTTGAGGCAWAGWDSAEAGSPIRFPATASADYAGPTISAFISQPDDEERAALVEAIGAVVEIFADPAFQELVENETWLASDGECGGRFPHAAVEGTKVVEDVLVASYMHMHYLVNWYCSDSIAVTIPARGTVIRSYQVDKWGDPRATVRAELVDTIAHELAHVAPGKGDSTYSDGLHTSCTETALVSYHLGDMAGCWYRQKHGVAEAFEKCLESMRPQTNPEACKADVERLRQPCPKPPPGTGAAPSTP